MGNEVEPPQRFLTVREAAKLLDLPTKTIRSMIRRGELPAFKVGSQWRLRESELTQWIQAFNKP